MHDLLCLVEHLHFFFGISVILEYVDLGDDVISQLIGKLLHGDGFAFQYFTILLFQLGHGCGTRTAGSLIAGHVDTFDMAQVFDRLQSRHHHDGRTVRVGDDAARTLQGIGCVAFGYDERHVLVHAESAGVIYHDCPVTGDVFGKFFGCAGTGRGKGDVDVFKIIVVLKKLHFDFFATEFVFGTCTAG